MYGEIFNTVKRLFPDTPLLPYLKNIENAPYDKDRFMSLYLIKTSVSFSGKKEAEYQLLVATKTPRNVNEEDIQNFEKDVYEITEKLYKELPIVQGSVEFGLSDTYMYAYVRFTVRFK